MAKGLNKVMLIGNLGRDPELRYTPSGNAVANVSVATPRSYKDKQSGEWVEQTDWHRVVLWGRLAEVAGEYLRKGAKVYIEGRLETRKWQNRDGQDQYTTEVIASDMQMLGGRPGGEGSRSSGSQEQPPRQGQTPPPPSQPQMDDFDDDIPF